MSEEAASYRMEVHAESRTRAVNTIERRHPGRTVRVVFPIDPEEFFVEGPQEIAAVQDESRLAVQDPMMGV